MAPMLSEYREVAIMLTPRTKPDPRRNVKKNLK